MRETTLQTARSEKEEGEKVFPGTGDPPAAHGERHARAGGYALKEAAAWQSPQNKLLAGAAACGEKSVQEQAFGRAEACAAHTQEQPVPAGLYSCGQNPCWRHS